MPPQQNQQQEQQQPAPPPAYQAPGLGSAPVTTPGQVSESNSNSSTADAVATASSPKPQHVTMELGNISAPSTTHAERWDWRFFLKAGCYAKEVDKVVVHMHPTFQVSTYDLVTPDAAGTFWTVPISGWGVFELKIDVHFTNGRGRVELLHMLELKTPMVSRHVVVPAHHVMCSAALTAETAVKRGPTLAPASITVPPPWITMQQQQMQAQMQAQGSAQPRSLPQMQHQQIVTPSPMPFGGSYGFGYGGRRHQGAAEITAPEKITILSGKPDDKKHTVLALVLDRSGSMSAMGNEVEGGANAYLDEQRKSDIEDGAHTTVVMCTFDSKVDTLYENVDLTSVPPITHAQVEPRGCTALYDGIGEALVKTAAIVNRLETKPSVTIFILTDGHENSSKKWSKTAIAAEIEKLQKPENGSWDFYFAAANQDAMREGSTLGMDSEQCITFSGKSGAKMRQTMAMTNVAYQRKKRSNGARKGWSAQERMSCM